MNCFVTGIPEELALCGVLLQKQKRFYHKHCMESKISVAICFCPVAERPFPSLEEDKLKADRFAPLVVEKERKYAEKLRSRSVLSAANK